MGVCLSACFGEEKPPRTDLPQKGQSYKFSVKAKSLVSGDFIVYDSTEEDDRAPWLHFQHSGSFDSDSGTMKVVPLAPESNQGTLLNFQVNGVELAVLDSKHKSDDGGWFDWDEDEKLSMAWVVERSVELAGGDVRLNCKFKGKAKAKKDVDYEEEGREVEWKSEAETKEVTYTVVSGGEEMRVEHSLQGVLSHSGSYEATYSVPGLGFKASYVSRWGLDEVHVEASETSDPVLAVSLGFLLAYWMHPERIEDDTARQALAILRSRVSSW